MSAGAIITDRDLLAIQIETLYRCDEQGRLLVVNEPDWDVAAPLLFVGRTATGNLWRCRSDLPGALVAEIDRICTAEPVVKDFSQRLQGYDRLLALLRSYAPIHSLWRGPAYVFPHSVAAPADVVAINDENRSLVARFLPEMASLAADYAPYMRLVDGAAVAVCFSSRVASRACEAGLETAQGYRRRGHGAAVTCGWAAAIQRSGRLALYSTSWANLASQNVARSLGLHLYGEDISFGS